MSLTKDYTTKLRMALDLAVPPTISHGFDVFTLTTIH